MTSRKVTVAVVDNDRNFLCALERLLRAAGFETRAYASGEAFLQDFPALDVDCAILDIRMDAMSGFDVARQLAVDAMRPPLIFITAHDEGDTREQARRIGCTAYLCKPFSAQELLDAIYHAVKNEGDRP